MMIVLFAASIVCNTALMLCFKGPWWSEPVLFTGHTLGKVALFCIFFLAGVFQGMLDPLFLELAAEVAYPSPEGTSAGLLTFLYNVAALLVLTVSPFISAATINFIYTLVFAVCVVLISGVEERYLRSESVCEHCTRIGDTSTNPLLN